MAGPYFVAGTGRCGTSQLVRVLGEHPDVHALRWESRFLVGGQAHMVREDPVQPTVDPVSPGAVPGGGGRGDHATPVSGRGLAPGPALGAIHPGWSAELAGTRLPPLAGAAPSPAGRPPLRGGQDRRARRPLARQQAGAVRAPRPARRRHGQHLHGQPSQPPRRPARRRRAQPGHQPVAVGRRGARLLIWARTGGWRHPPGRRGCRGVSLRPRGRRDGAGGPRSRPAGSPGRTRTAHPWSPARPGRCPPRSPRLYAGSAPRRGSR